MSDLVVIAPKNIDEAKSLASTLAPAALLPDALKQKPADVLAIIMTGAELGFGPMQAIRAISIIKGKPSMYADAMAALVKRRRDVCEYLVCEETSEKLAKFKTMRAGDPSPTTLVYTIEQAQKAGLASQDNYRRHPDAMLRARALAAICRLVYPDLVFGLYDPSELEVDAPGPAPARLEKDVTPQTKTEEVKGQVKAALQAAKASRMPIQDNATLPAGPTPFERIRELGEKHGKTGKALSSFVIGCCGRKTKEALTAEDVEKVAAALSAAATPAEVTPSGEPPDSVVLPGGEPPPHTDSDAVPF